MSAKKDKEELVLSKKNAIAKVFTSEDSEYNTYLKKLSPEKKQRIARLHQEVKSGAFNTAPLICLGPSKCPMLYHCPIPEKRPDGTLDVGPLSEYPIHRPCVMEKMFMQEKVLEYLDQLNVDPGNPVEMAYVHELAIIDLYKNRAQMIMAGGDRDGHGRDFIKTDIKEQQGEYGTLLESKTMLHPIVEQVDRLERRRAKVLDSFMETRKGKMDASAKLGQSNTDSALREELAALKSIMEHVLKQGPISPKTKSSIDDTILIDD